MGRVAINRLLMAHREREEKRRRKKKGKYGMERLKRKPHAMSRFALTDAAAAAATAAAWLFLIQDIDPGSESIAGCIGGSLSLSLSLLPASRSRKQIRF